MSGKQAIEKIISPVVTAMGYEFFGCEVLSQGRFVTLRVFIDKTVGVTLDDCQQVSRQISAVLDVEDPILTRYTLEVSSPGLDRPLLTLEHFERYIGQMASVRLMVPQEGRRNFTGKIIRVEGENIILNVDGQEFSLPHDSIAKANLVM